MTGLERRSIHLDGHAHGALPIPAASSVGNIIATGGVRGVDRATGVMPEDAAEQVSNMFVNLIALIEAGGGNAETIVKVTVYIKGPECRSALNGPWTKCFPDPERRPARHVQEVPALGGGMLVQCDALAVAL